MARPSKIEPFVEAAEDVLFDDINAIIFTDEELVDAINERLAGDEKITHRTFQNWKAKAIAGELDTEPGKRFFVLLKRALREQKKNLFEEFKESSQWQKYAWIIERKFDDWNIKHKHDHTTKDKPMNKFQVEVVNKKDEG